MRYALVLMLGMGLLLACDSDEDDHAHEEHIQAVGMSLVSIASGDTLVQATGGNASDLSGELALVVGQTLGPLQACFLNDHGDWFIPEHEEHEEEEHSIQIGSSALFSAVIDMETSQLSLTGLQAGTDSVRVMVLHGDHEDYVSPEFAVNVTAP